MIKHLVMGTAGHVDHGKTSLIKALTDVDCDTHKEEKQRGITINLGFTYLDHPNGDSVGIIDVPGHKDFIHTMVGGASGIDFVLMVIAADSGIMPQTREHFNILKILGVKKGIIALTKIDLVDEDLIEMAKYEISALLKDTFLENSSIVEVSAITKKGIDDLKEVIFKTSQEIEERPKGNFFRMYIDRIFSVKGFGSVVTGTILNGRTDLSKTIYLLPGSKKKLRIRRIEKHEKSTNEVSAGDRAAINLVGLERNDFERGMIISDRQLESTKILDANLTLFENSSLLNLWSQVILHTGTYEGQARIHLLSKKELSESEHAMVQIHLEKECVLLPGDRFVIRNTSSDQTLGGGIVVDINPLHHRRRTDKLVESMLKIAKGSLSELISIEVKKKLIPVLAENIAMNLNKPFEKIIEECNTAGFEEIAIYKTGDSFILFDKDRDQKFFGRVIDEIKTFHKKNPIIPNGLTTEELKSKFGLVNISIGDQYISFLLKKLESQGLIKKSENTWILPNHKVNITEEIKKNIDWLEHTITNYDKQTPVLSEIKSEAKKRGINDNELNQYLHFLARTEKIYFLEDNYISAKVVDECRMILLKELCMTGKGLSIADFRDLIDANRKISLLLIARYDSEKIIKRTGDFRIITKKGRDYFNKKVNKN